MAGARHLEFKKKLPLGPVPYFNLNVMKYLRSKFRINRPIWRLDIAKKTIFNMASVRHLEFVLASS